jgi:hypothetical protein
METGHERADAIQRRGSAIRPGRNAGGVAIDGGLGVVDGTVCGGHLVARVGFPEVAPPQFVPAGALAGIGTSVDEPDALLAEQVG